MMLKKRLEIAERNAKLAEQNVKNMMRLVARVASVVDAARAFVRAQSPLAHGDFAGDKFQELEAAVLRLNASLPPEDPTQEGPG